MEVQDLVNERDEVIGSCTREEHGDPKIITRNIVVFLTDVHGRHAVQVRSMTKKHWAGCLDFAACGSVKQGESYVQAAERELEEELGVRCDLAPLLKEYREVPRKEKVIRLFTTYFTGVYSGGFKKTEEVDELLLLSNQEVEQLIAKKDARVMDYFLQEWKLLKTVSAHRS